MDTSIEFPIVAQYLDLALSLLLVAVTALFAGVAYARIGKEPGAILTCVGAGLFFVHTASGMVLRYLIFPSLTGDSIIVIHQIYGLVYASLNIAALGFIAAGILGRSRAV